MQYSDHICARLKVEQFDDTWMMTWAIRLCWDPAYFRNTADGALQRALE